MKKILFCIGLMSLLSGCYVERSICFAEPYLGLCQHDTSDFDGYSKIGQTKKQKTIDIKDCGATISGFGNIFPSLLERAKEENKNGNWYSEIQTRVKLIKEFDQCMERKGYKFYYKLYD